ncbi:Uncharacterised protein [Mycobacterium tuberculosis]|nr:Uncharacterised protein [Mycobacterium tuberculosis]
MASVISGRRPPARPAKSIVGWNWMNSRSLTATPAHNPRAMPSPVEPAGLVVALYRCPSPPVARITDGALIMPHPSGLTTNSPVTAVPSCSTRNATWPVRISSIPAASWSAR